MDKDFTNNELQFHYQRENRIKNASDIVQAHYNGEDKQTHGFFKSLVATKSSRFLFGGIVLLLVMIFFAKNIDKIVPPSNIEGIPVDATAFLFDSTVYVTVTAKEASVEKDIPLTVCFNAKNNENKIIETSTIYSIFDGNENLLRTTFSKQDILTVECQISTETEAITLKTTVQK